MPGALLRSYHIWLVYGGMVSLEIFVVRIANVLSHHPVDCRLRIPHREQHCAVADEDKLLEFANEDGEPPVRSTVISQPPILASYYNHVRII